ncbi:hypothetical protein METBIDRAFT_10024 [Metschnikowia bicuspidata var. bicuspidata NRRL YB-4993]|uniref:Secreted protein n=1 Tax=Metschnikowia bicuspidata var. bicuspidata NRRL YB-4993 TaxID=869754 RepID=A0A1A0HIY7_9ASCO|nr:hypothetical protein METBIDRAFT_10024 [Metschnikowia bicuspidata var. bicuspidata NRRL YB-4993]OBA23803.1 hypothetical protein METBIDRAFT_10024 [Metschnikowia bicuspidata var. bicuspidata NRRL YB-4993]
MTSGHVALFLVRPSLVRVHLVPLAWQCEHTCLQDLSTDSRSGKFARAWGATNGISLDAVVTRSPGLSELPLSTRWLRAGGNRGNIVSWSFPSIQRFASVSGPEWNLGTSL